MSSSANGTLTSEIRPMPAPPMPTHVNGFPVIAGAKINSRGGEYRHQWAVICDRGTDFDRYAVWFAYWIDDRKDRDGQPMPPSVAANEGGYYTDLGWAVEDYTHRLTERGMAEG